MLMARIAVPLALLLIASPGFAAEPLDFNRDVRPILSAHCFTCHGPDAKSRKADLRLDRADSALEDRGGYAAIVPKAPEKSAVWQRLTSTNPSRRMPPPQTKKQLSTREMETLRNWIAQGGSFERHWSFVPVRRPPVPAVKQLDWIRNPVARFIMARLEREKLAPSAPTDPQRWLRRVYLDLIGLPPDAAEVAAFEERVAQTSGLPHDIIDSVVDRLLASPRFGERWAVPWLDQARYADSNGYQADQLRELWAYRDWVIQALNSDMPLDRFVIEQLAGDLLPKATIAQKVATGFHRTVTCN